MKLVRTMSEEQVAAILGCIGQYIEEYGVNEKILNKDMQSTLKVLDDRAYELLYK